jgi:hypothetical protein
MREAGGRRGNLQCCDTLDINRRIAFWHYTKATASNQQENSYFVLAGNRKKQQGYGCSNRGCETRMKPNENSNGSFEYSAVSSSHNASETFVAKIRNIR